MLNHPWKRGSGQAIGSILGFLLAAGPLLAQSTTASMQGSVRDEQQGMVPAAVVNVRSVDTNANRSTVSDAQGRWRAVNLPVGPYEVKVELAGFKTHLRSGITLALNQ